MKRSALGLGGPSGGPGRAAARVRCWLSSLTMPLVLALAAGCASSPPAQAPSAPAPPQQPGLADVLDRPSERALFDGLRAYDEGQYEGAESALRAALAGTLRSPRDKAMAHKLLAFIYCTSNRESLCEAAFKAARENDASFRLSRAESGHPLWGPVYRRVFRLP